MTPPESYPDPVAHLAAIVRHSDDAIISKRLDSTITSWNLAAERMFGHTAAEAIGRSIRMIIPRDRWAEEDEVLAQLRRGEVVDHFETVRQRKDGSFVEVSLTVSPIKDEAGRIVGASKISRDISERKRAEEERRRAERERERLLEAAEVANRAKDQFLAVLSHELRTPLNAIAGWSEVLCHAQVDPATMERGLRAISRNVQAQVKLIEDLLDVSRIASGKVRLEARALQVAPVVTAAIEAIGPAAEAKQIRVDAALDPAAVVLGDADRLQQVIWNLLSNAVKFTPAGGHVQVGAATAGAHVEIAVSDDGRGIAPDYLPFVFDRFSQADTSSRRHFGGLGLGLSIARELVELHGGTIEAASEGEGRGTTFTVRLPSLPPRQPPPPADARRPPAGADRAAGDPAGAGRRRPDLSGVLVLVVDDDEGTREITAEILLSFGAEVLLAASAPEALESLVRRRPDVLLADVEMPGEDGYSLIDRVRALPAHGGGATPAAAVTAFARAEDSERALDAGFQLHIAKPIDPLGLASAVARLAGRPASPAAERS